MQKYLLFIFLWLSLPSYVFSEFIADFQGGPVYTGYNDVRIPGDDGTKFSLSDDLKARTAWSARAETGYKFQEHYLGILFTPLRVKSSGTLDKDINFNDKTFTAGSKLEAMFRFDSYRLMYRYTFYSGTIFSIGAGFTAKIRDASISLEGGGVKTEKKNTGFVPILNFAIEAKLPADFFLFFGGDALAAPQGRAEDIALLAGYKINDIFRIKAGYRMLEGGADNDEVYTFSMFHYAVFGIETSF
jgi:hypothetical protein